MARRLWRPRPWHRRFAAQPKGGSTALIDVLASLGLTTGLQFALDAGDAASYTSGQSWLDRSGNGQDFFLGADGSAGASDPTFNSDGYFTFDAGDYFTYDATNEAWMTNQHHDGAAYTILMAVYLGATGAAGLWGGHGSVATQNGILLGTNASTQLAFSCANGSGSFAATATVGAALSAGQWYILGISVDEAATTGALFVNSTANTFTSTYTSPSSGDATTTYVIGARGGGGNPLKSGSRMAWCAGWDRSLTSADEATIYAATRGRLGI